MGTHPRYAQECPDALDPPPFCAFPIPRIVAVAGLGGCASLVVFFPQASRYAGEVRREPEVPEYGREREAEGVKAVPAHIVAPRRRREHSPALPASKCRPAKLTAHYGTLE